MTHHDNKLAKNAQTMTAGVTQSGIEQYDPIVLHDAHLIKVIATDGSETIAQYENGAQRVFSTFDLASYRELGAFPCGAAFHRRTDKGIESLFIEHVNPDTYIVEKVILGQSTTETISYADLMTWHDGGEKLDPSISLIPGTHLYVPKTTVPVATPETKAEAVDEDIEKIVEVLEEVDAELDSNPFEEELQKRIEQLEAELAAAEVNGQSRINELMQENRKLNADLLKQHDIHVTQFLAKNEQIARLEEKAAIIAPVCKEYLMRQNITESDLNKLAKEGWQIQHLQYMTDVDFSGQLWAVFIRDLPAAPAPKLVEKAAEDGLYIGAIPLTQRPPVQRPPMPVNQTVILNQPTSRALTNNGPKPGDTRKVTVPVDNSALKEAFERGQVIYNQRMAEGTAALNQAARSFNQGA